MNTVPPSARVDLGRVAMAAPAHVVLGAKALGDRLGLTIGKRAWFGHGSTHYLTNGKLFVNLDHPRRKPDQPLALLVDLILIADGPGRAILSKVSAVVAMRRYDSQTWLLAMQATRATVGASSLSN